MGGNLGGKSPVGTKIQSAALPTEADPWAKCARGADTKDSPGNLRVGGGCREAKGEQIPSVPPCAGLEEDLDLV